MTSVIMDAVTKACTKCGETHAIEDFPRDRSRTSGRHERCKFCNRAAALAWSRENPARAKARWQRWNDEDPERTKKNNWRACVKYKYGISLEEYDALLAKGCAICGASPSDTRMHLDHDHESGAVRAALCHGCNCAIGFLAEDPKRVRAAADYLESHRS